MKFNCAYKELIDVDSPTIIPNPKNPNIHPQLQIERLAKIIDYQGQRSPIVISKRSGFITKGHGRFEAIKKLGWKKIAVDFQDYDSEAQEYADIVSDNTIAEWSELDKFKLYEDLKEIDLGNFELLGIEKDIFKNIAESEITPLNVDDIETNYSFSIKCESKMEFDKIKNFFNTDSKMIKFSKVEHLLI